jgi:alpha-N-arabinofuranosidase
MLKIKRREFVGSVLAAGAVSLLPRAAYAGRATDSRIEVLVTEPIATIAPEIYGHFTEHLGAVIYDGIWVGPESKIPNIGGVRRALIESLQRIKPAVIRWPGGCFADSYDWRDGIGPRRDRPRRTNFWFFGVPDKPVPNPPQKYDPNQFGTNEFARFCKLVGAEPYLAANLRSLPARDFYQWVEYCNSPAGSTTLADQRALAGDREPFRVRYWGVGNESWGCGGNFTADEYAVEFRRFTAWVPGFDVKLAFVGSGPSSNDLNWTRKFFSKLIEKGEGQLNSLFGWGLHHYSWNLSKGLSNDWDGAKGDALQFDVETWYELFRQGEQVESFINDHWAAMGEFDKQHRVKLVVDEWGSWYKPGTEADPRHLLEQGSTMRDALLAGISLDIFNRNADKVAMANIAQLVNCLQSLFLAREDQFTVTPTYHVFDMYSRHQGKKALRMHVEAPDVKYNRVGKPATFWGLKGSASLGDKELILTVVNPHVSEARATEINLRGATARSGSVTTLAESDIHAHNTFAEPRAVMPKEAPLAVSGPSFTHEFPPASVTRIRVELA